MIYTPEPANGGEPPAIYKLDSIWRAGGARAADENRGLAASQTRPTPLMS